MKVRYHLEAVEEYEEAVDYYAAISPQLAARLIEEIEHCIERISEHLCKAGKFVRIFEQLSRKFFLTNLSI